MIEIPEEFVLASCYTGSSVICNPPVLDTDIDVVILVDDLEETLIWLHDNGWKICGESYKWSEISTFSAYRKGKYNYIIVNKLKHFNQWEAATLLATQRNLLNKQDRINLFEDIVDKIK